MPKTYTSVPDGGWFKLNKTLDLYLTSVLVHCINWIYPGIPGTQICKFCVEVLWPSQPNVVMSIMVNLPKHTFTGQAYGPLSG